MPIVNGSWVSDATFERNERIKRESDDRDDRSKRNAEKRSSQMSLPNGMRESFYQTVSGE